MFLINGQAGDTLSATNRGLHYGDGVFETIAVYNKVPLCWDDHYRRLDRGCTRLGMDCPSSDLLRAETASLITEEGALVLKIILTRGEGGRGYRPPEHNVEPCRIVGLYPWPDYPGHYINEGIRVRFCETRLARNPSLAGIKHLNRLEQVMARSEWQDDDIAEGLMLDTDNHLIEGTMSNLFIIRGKQLRTPDLTQCGIEGVIRQHVLDLAGKIGLEPIVCEMNKDEIDTADEIFLCNSIIGVWPVQQIGDHRLDPAPQSQKIRQLLADFNLIRP